MWMHRKCGSFGGARSELCAHGYPLQEETAEYVAMGTLNGLFVLGRSIGFIGHYIDQNRLKQGLYRHPTEDISYITDARLP